MLELEKRREERRKDEGRKSMGEGKRLSIHRRRKQI